MRKFIISLISILVVSTCLYAATYINGDQILDGTIKEAKLGFTIATGLSALNISTMLNGDYTGEVIVDGMAASATVGQCLYLASGGWTIAKADAIATLPALGLCVETGTGNRKVLTHGFIRNTSWSFTKGNRIYVSPSTAGAITATRPSTGGQFIQAIGVALSADVVYFSFDDTVAGL